MSADFIQKDQLKRSTHNHTAVIIWHPLDDTQHHSLLTPKDALLWKSANSLWSSLADEVLRHNCGYVLVTVLSFRAHVHKTQATCAWLRSFVLCLTLVSLTMWRETCPNSDVWCYRMRTLSNANISQCKLEAVLLI